MPSSRMRIYQVSNKINLKSKVFVISPFPFKKFSKKRILEFFINLFLLLKIKKNDIIYLHKTVFQWDFIFLILFLDFFKKYKIIFDFDDPVFLYCPKKTKILTRKANAVIVGSHYLLEYSLKNNKNSFLVPTSVDYGMYSKSIKPAENEHNVTIGWIGTQSNLENLLVIKNVFLNLKFNFELLILTAPNVGKKIYEILPKEKIKIKYIFDIDWTNEQNIVNNILKIDIGIMPLFDSLENRGKCAFKAIQYMSCGIPTICSSVGENNYLIKNGINGFLAEDVKGWIKALELLIENENLRKKIGEAGKKTIEEKYSLKVNIPLIENIIKSIFYNS